jgi:hypothetical protein
VRAWQIFGEDNEPLFIQQDEASAKRYAEAGHRVERLGYYTTPPAAPVPLTDEQVRYMPDCWVVVKNGRIIATHDEPCHHDGIQAVRYAPAAPVQEPVAWRFTGIAGFNRFVTDAQYKAFSPEVRAWYEPFKCATCTTPTAAPVQPVAQAIIHAITEYGDARADQDANNAPTTSHERLADCIRLIRDALPAPAQPAPVQPVQPMAWAEYNFKKGRFTGLTTNDINAVDSVGDGCQWVPQLQATPPAAQPAVQAELDAASSQEPIGEVRNGEAYFYNGMYTNKTDAPDGTKLYTAPPAAQPAAPVQEPLMVDMHPPATQRDRWMYEQGRLAERDPRSHPTPPAAPVPLTDDQISAIGSKIFPSTWNTRHVEFARAIEAKLKETNT